MTSTTARERSRGSPPDRGAGGAPRRLIALNSLVQTWTKRRRSIHERVPPRVNAPPAELSPRGQAPSVARSEGIIWRLVELADPLRVKMGLDR
jgi:hypothetical protein